MRRFAVGLLSFQKPQKPPVDGVHVEVASPPVAMPPSRSGNRRQGITDGIGANGANGANDGMAGAFCRS